MDEINTDLGSDPGTGEARIESDRLQPVIRLRGRSKARWPMGFLVAVVAVLAASGLALGAEILPVLQSGGPGAHEAARQALVEPTPLLIDGSTDPTDPTEPTDAPTPAPTPTRTSHPASAPSQMPTLDPTVSPTAIPTVVPTVTARPTTPRSVATAHPTNQTTMPPSGYLSFAVQNEGGCARLYWASFDDPSRAYYRIVRSTDPSAEWPLGANDTLAASVRDASQVTALDCPAAGTYTYRVFVDTATTAGYVVLVSSHSLTITLGGSTPTAPITPTSTPTAAPTPAPVDMGPLSVTKNANGTYTISWNAYSGPLAITSYALCYTTNENASFGYVEKFGGVIGVSKTATSWTGTFPWAATLKVKIEALYYPPSAAAQKAGETQIVVIPYTAPTSTPTPTPPPAPTATPVSTATAVAP